MSGVSVIDNALRLFDEREYHQVLKLCQNTLELKPLDSDLRVIYARALLATRQDDKAQKELRQCLRVNPKKSDAYRLLGELSLKREEYESSRMFLHQALRLDPTDVDAKQLLSIVQSVQGTPVGLIHDVKTEITPAAEKPNAILTSKPDLPPPTTQRGFGNYLLRVGMLDDDQLTEVIDYHNHHHVRIGQAAVILGYISAPKIEWAALAYHSIDRND